MNKILDISYIRAVNVHISQKLHIYAAVFAAIARSDMASSHGWASYDI